MVNHVKFDPENQCDDEKEFHVSQVAKVCME
jgi:hypothetical protein